MSHKAVSQNAQSTAGSSQNQLLIVAQVGKAVTFDIAKACYCSTSTGIYTHVPVYAGIGVGGLGIGIRSVPLVEHRFRQCNPVVWSLEVIDVQETADIVQHVGRTVGEVLMEQLVTFGHIVLVDGV